MADFLVGMREAATIWLALVALGLAAFAFLLVTDPSDRSAVARARARFARRGRRAMLATNTPTVPLRVTPVVDELADVRRYAEEVAVAAARAALTTQRCRAEELAAQRTQDAAWRAYDAAEVAARRAVAARAFATPPTPLTEAEQADRQRYLHTAATAAYQRGELSVKQLRDVLLHRNGWDPSRHPLEQEALLRRVGLQRLMRAYHIAAESAAAAECTTDVAAKAQRCLAEEALDAALRARDGQTRAAASHSRSRLRTRIGRRPSFATPWARGQAA
jgi:hypothetical protein